MDGWAVGRRKTYLFHLNLRLRSHVTEPLLPEVLSVFVSHPSHIRNLVQLARVFPIFSVHLPVIPVIEFFIGAFSDSTSSKPIFSKLPLLDFRIKPPKFGCCLALSG